ncbi:MAG: lysylphosphatidylglycerol synthase domain-containing protein [Bacteroidota bacterium]|nr:lysylphosphatidylglycerol synthase domain-containing protein [Bacteroidota bacterium]
MKTFPAWTEAWSIVVTGRLAVCSRLSLETWAGPAVKLALAALVLWVVTQSLGTGVSAGLAGATRPAALCVAVALLLPNLAVQFLKWRTLVRRVLPDVRDVEAAVSLLGGFALGLVTPARAGEFGGRAWALPRADAAATAAVTVVDKASTFIVTCGAGVAGAMILWAGGASSPVRTVLIGGGCAAVFITVLLLAMRVRVFRNLRGTIPGKGKLARAVHGALEAAAAVGRGDLVSAFCWSAVFYAVFTTQFLLFLSALGTDVSWPIACGVAAVLLAKTVIPPVTFGELGIREGTSILILAPLGVAAPAAFGASLLLFGVNVLLPSAAGAVWLASTSRVRHSHT